MEKSLNVLQEMFNYKKFGMLGILFIINILFLNHGKLMSGTDIKFGRRRNWNGINKKTVTIFQVCNLLNIKYISKTFHAIIKYKTKVGWSKNYDN